MKGNLSIKTGSDVGEVAQLTFHDRNALNEPTIIPVVTAHIYSIYVENSYKALNL